MLVIGAVEMVDHTTKKPQKPKRFGAKYLDTMSGRVQLAAIPSNEATHIHAFIKANIAPGTTLVSDASYLADYRHDPRVVGSMAGHVPPQMDPSGLRPLEAVEPRHLPPPPTHRFVPERIRLPLQPTILSTCLVRDRAWLGDAPRAGSLLGHHRAEKPSQSFPDNQATATPSQDSQRISSGRRTHLKLDRSVIRR